MDWTVELDDGGGADRVLTVPGPVREGQILEGYDRHWAVDRVEPDRLFAHAKLAETPP
jgi:hypothetical protein